MGWGGGGGVVGARSTVVTSRERSSSRAAGKPPVEELAETRAKTEKRERQAGGTAGDGETGTNTRELAQKTAFHPG